MRTKFLWLVILTFIITPSHAQIDPQLESTIKNVIQGFKSQNDQIVQKYIHPTYGFIYWNKIGVPINQGVYPKAEFHFPKKNSDASNQWFYTAPDAEQKLMHTTKLPTIDCPSWNYAGLLYLVNNSHPFSELSKLNKSIIESSDEEFDKQLQEVQPFEKQLVELQYVGKSRTDGDDLHLFFSKINGKWYFSGLDNSSKCDA